MILFIMIKLKALVKDISGLEIKGSDELLIKGMSSNSKAIFPGDLFIAKKGKTFDGAKYISQAIEGGACAIATDVYQPSFRQVVQVIHSDISSIESLLASRFYQNPSQELYLVGITGTNGKTTTSYIVKKLLEHFFGSCGLIGTIECLIGELRYPSSHTTPDVITNHKILREMTIQKCHLAVMEVSSHALVQKRVDQINFDVAIFTNLTLEHLDYHETMEAYGKAKKILFQQLNETGEKKRLKWAIVNNDSPWSPLMLEGCSANILTYGIENDSDLQASDIHLEQDGTYAKVSFMGKHVDCFWPIVGRFNIYNCLAAIAVCLTRDIPLDLIASQMRQISEIRGRLQAVKNSLGIQIYVDYAHSDDALLNVLKTLVELKNSSERLVVVFGCGGDRDRSKRPKMARACEIYADFCILTSDNPRSEDPVKICEEARVGFTKSTGYEVEIDRRAAISKAIKWARPGDMILIAGKGHEAVQIFAHKTIEFDDCQVASEICSFITSSNRPLA